MTRNRWPLLAAVLLLALPLAACGQDVVGAAQDPHVVVEELPGSELSRITLSARAAERLGIETAVVEELATSDGVRLTVPFSAVLYDSNGKTWTYVSHEELVFVRELVVIDYVEDEVAVLTDAPAPGTTVVTIGAAELYGAETGVGGGH